MKQLSFLIIILILSSCGISVKQIGSLNMIQNRNVDSNFNYKSISTYSGGSDRERKSSRSLTIEDAIDNTVRKIPGGEFLTNVKIYIVNDLYFSVEGDVWGKQENITYRGFKVGDKVTWKVSSFSKNKYLTGVLKSLKNNKTCLITEDESGEIIELIYDKISKID